MMPLNIEWMPPRDDSPEYDPPDDDEARHEGRDRRLLDPDAEREEAIQRLTLFFNSHKPFCHER